MNVKTNNIVAFPGSAVPAFVADAQPAPVNQALVDGLQMMTDMAKQGRLTSSIGVGFTPDHDVMNFQGDPPDTAYVAMVGALTITLQDYQVRVARRDAAGATRK